MKERLEYLRISHPNNRMSIFRLMHFILKINKLGITNFKYDLKIIGELYKKEKQNI